MSIHKFKGGAGDKSINGNIVGAVKVKRASSKYTILSGFSDSDYFSSPVNFPSKPAGFNIILRVAFSQSSSTWQYFFGSKNAKLPLLGFVNGKLGVHLGTNGSSWTVWGPSYGVTTLGLNRYYYIKMEQDESGAFMLQTSLDGETWTTEISTASGQSPVVGDCPFYIGAGWTSGAATYANIDFQSSYIKIYNNSVWTTLWEGTRWSHIDKVLHGAGYTYNVDIQGSPTISNGTVSGFTTSNYVQLPTPFNPGTGAEWELMLHFKTGAVNTGTEQEVFNRCVNTHYGFRIGISANVAKLWYTIDAGTSSHNFEQGGSNTLEANTEYWLRFKFNGSKYTSEISTDGSTWTQDISYDATFKITTTTNANTLGVNNSKIRPFQGEIYLKDCYINLSYYRWWTGAYNVKNIESVYTGQKNTFCLTHIPQDIKLELDPVKVTIVGSPTFDKGVVSGFSASNYLKISDSFDVSGGKTWEMVLKVITGSDVSSGQSMCGHDSTSSNYDPVVIYVRDSKFHFTIANSSSSSLADGDGITTVLANTTYWLKMVFTGSKYILSQSLDGIEYTEEASASSSTSIWTSNLLLGQEESASTAYPWLGAIDISQSYIKINGNIWWKSGSGVLTLKAGSKLYVPNGFEADGTTRKFDVVSILQDLTYTRAISMNEEVVVRTNDSGQISLDSWFNLSSSDSAPSVTETYMLWYDTANNLIKGTGDNGATWVERGFSLPIAKIQSDNTSITSIDQVFNGCGYIGEVAYVLPGVEGLAADGKDSQGKNKSIQSIVSNVIVYNTNTYSNSAKRVFLKTTTLNYVICIENNFYQQATQPTPVTYGAWYDTANNLLYHIGGDTSDGWLPIKGFPVFTLQKNGSSISAITPYSVQPEAFPVRVFGKDQLTKTFTATGSLQTYVVPNYAGFLNVTAVGAKGYNGANGGKVTTVLKVNPGETLYVWAGQYGTNAQTAIYNASDIRTKNVDVTSTEGLNSRLVVAGAGGSYVSGYTAGKGGGLTGGQGSSDILNAAGGGTQTAGGAHASNRRATVTHGPWYGGNGQFGLGGTGMVVSGYGTIAAGGSGWYGGGGGCFLGAKNAGYQNAGGGGGSSYTHPTLCSNVVHTQGAAEASGNGYVIISPVIN